MYLCSVRMHVHMYVPMYACINVRIFVMYCMYGMYVLYVMYVMYVIYVLYVSYVM